MKNIKEIVNLAFEIHERDKKIDEALLNYLGRVSPDTRHFTFHEYSEFVWFLKWVEMFDKELSDLLSYFFYECDMKGYVEYIWKVWEFSTKEEFITFLEEYEKEEIQKVSALLDGHREE